MRGKVPCRVPRLRLIEALTRALSPLSLARFSFSGKKFDQNRLISVVLTAGFEPRNRDSNDLNNSKLYSLLCYASKLLLLALILPQTTVYLLTSVLPLSYSPPHSHRHCRTCILSFCLPYIADIASREQPTSFPW